MAGKVKIRFVSNLSIIVTILLFGVFIGISVLGYQQYSALRSAMQDYMYCEHAVKELQDGSDILTKQVRLAAATGEQQYIDAYFEEANVTKTREKALEDLSKLDGSASSVLSLRKALSTSVKLMQIEYYSMRLVEEAQGVDPSTWPVEIKTVTLRPGDAALSPEDKLEKARMLVISLEYETAKNKISTDVNAAASTFSNIIKDRQTQASEIFIRTFEMIIGCMIVFALMMLIVCLIMRYWIVRPLVTYSKNVQHDSLLEVSGAYELQKLGETYNKIYRENEERQKLIKHQAEHDPLTDLLNRGSYDRIFNLYDRDHKNFALIIVDIDTFKSVNDTYGHAIGDELLKKVGYLLTIIFRNIDYVCRIGGDEFAVIMVEMTSDLSYTIIEKITEINRRLANPDDGLPPVSISVGVAFTDRKDPGKSQFTDADNALYYTKENGKAGVSFYPYKKKY